MIRRSEGTVKAKAEKDWRCWQALLVEAVNQRRLKDGEDKDMSDAEKGTRSRKPEGMTRTQRSRCSRYELWLDDRLPIVYERPVNGLDAAISYATIGTIIGTKRHEVARIGNSRRGRPTLTELRARVYEALFASLDAFAAALHPLARAKHIPNDFYTSEPLCGSPGRAVVQYQEANCPMCRQHILAVVGAYPLFSTAFQKE